MQALTFALPLKKGDGILNESEGTLSKAKKPKDL